MSWQSLQVALKITYQEINMGVSLFCFLTTCILVAKQLNCKSVSQSSHGRTWCHDLTARTCQPPQLYRESYKKNRQSLPSCQRKTGKVTKANCAYLYNELPTAYPMYMHLAASSSLKRSIRGLLCSRMQRGRAVWCVVQEEDCKAAMYLSIQDKQYLSTNSLSPWKYTLNSKERYVSSHILVLCKHYSINPSNTPVSVFRCFQ